MFLLIILMSQQFSISRHVCQADHCRIVIVQQICHPLIEKGKCHPYEKRGDIERRGQKRLSVLNEVLAGRMTGQDAADLLGLSLRHSRRQLAGYRQEGLAACFSRAEDTSVAEVHRDSMFFRQEICGRKYSRHHRWLIS
jgi:hypothetical protein